MNTLSSAQSAMCRRFGVVGVAPDPEDKLGIALTSLHLVPLNAMRHRAVNGECGWYIWAGEHLSEATDFFAPLHVAHLSQYAPSLLPYIALPHGWRVLLAPNVEDVWYDEGLRCAG